MILPRLVFSVWFLWFRSALPFSLFLSLSWENRFNPRRDVQPSGRLSGFDAKHRMGINNAWAGHFTLFRCSRPFAGRVAPIKETAFRRVNFITMLDNHSFGWIQVIIWRRRVAFVDGKFFWPFLLEEWSWKWK